MSPKDSVSYHRDASISTFIAFFMITEKQNQMPINLNAYQQTAASRKWGTYIKWNFIHLERKCNHDIGRETNGTRKHYVKKNKLDSEK